MIDSPYETRLQGILVVVFSVAKYSICYAEYNSRDTLQARLIEGISHSSCTEDSAEAVCSLNAGKQFSSEGLKTCLLTKK